MKRFKEDKVNSPNHYTTGKIEVIDYIEDKLANPIDFYVGNVIKYTSRYNHKGRPLEDLQKARWYLGRAIEYLERGEGGE